MDLKIIGNTKDLRTGSHIIYAQMTIPDYLLLIGENYDEYGIQRRREKHRAYNRMKEDIKRGAVLPTITLAVNKHLVSDILVFINENKQEELKQRLETTGGFSILDGLQRTNILHEIKNEGHEFVEQQVLLLEFWVEPDIKHLIYRLIVLNAGQKPMSLRHQIELLFMTLAVKMKESIPGLDIYRETDSRRRSQSGQYPFERLVTSYQSFLWKTPELNKSNLIAQQMMEESVLDSSEESLNDTFNNFTYYLQKYTLIDEKSFEIYSDDPSKMNWLSLENVMNSFFSSITDFGINDERVERVNKSIDKLIVLLETGNEPDPLGLTIYYEIIQGIESRKINVGVATRKLLSAAFKEFFREEGDKSLSDCWRLEAQ